MAYGCLCCWPPSDLQSKARDHALSACARSDAQSAADGCHRLALRRVAMWSSRASARPLCGSRSGPRCGPPPASFEASNWVAHVVAVRARCRLVARVTLVHKGAGPSTHPTHAHGSGRASYRQSQGELAS